MPLLKRSCDRSKAINACSRLADAAKSIVTKYPDLDCVFLNSGTQTPIRLSRPAEVDLGAFHREINTNFTSLVDLSLKFLPCLLEKPFPTALVFTGSLIALVPAVTVPAYSASKAALSAFVDCLRRQNQGKSTKIIEIWPPAVQSKLPLFNDMILFSHLGSWNSPADRFQPSFTTTWVRKEAGPWACPSTNSSSRRGRSFRRVLTTSLWVL